MTRYEMNPWHGSPFSPAMRFYHLANAAKYIRRRNLASDFCSKSEVINATRVHMQLARRCQKPRLP